MIPAPRGCVGLDEDEIISDASSDYFSAKGATLGRKRNVARSARLGFANVDVTAVLHDGYVGYSEGRQL